MGYQGGGQPGPGEEGGGVPDLGALKTAMRESPS